MSQPESYPYNFKTSFIQIVSGLSVDDNEVVTEEEKGKLPYEGDRKRYKIQRVQVLSNDGAKVPMTLVHQYDLLHDDQEQPMLLNGYGCYGENVNTQFDSSIQLLVEKGFIVVSSCLFRRLLYSCALFISTTKGLLSRSWRGRTRQDVVRRRENVQ